MTERQQIALEMLKSGGMSIVHTSTGKQTENILKALDFADHFIAITENEENIRDLYRDMYRDNATEKGVGFEVTLSPNIEE